MKDCCANCALFKRRDPEMPWPRAGVPHSADGICGRKRLDKFVEWRSETDWCDHHKRAN